MQPTSAIIMRSRLRVPLQTAGLLVLVLICPPTGVVGNSRKGGVVTKRRRVFALMMLRSEKHTRRVAITSPWVNVVNKRNAGAGGASLPPPYPCRQSGRP
jgi:hypothetical protein